MTIHSSQPILAAACMGGSTTPSIDIVDSSAGHLNRRLALQRRSSDLVSCVACLPESDRLAVGALTGLLVLGTLHRLCLGVRALPHTSGSCYAFSSELVPCRLDLTDSSGPWFLFPAVLTVNSTQDPPPGP